MTLSEIRHRTWSPLENAALSLVVNTFQGYGDLALLKLKIGMQLKKDGLLQHQVSYNPIHLFRGGIPISFMWGVAGGIEALVDGYMEQQFKNPGEIQKVFSSAMGGAAAAPVVCAIEKVVTVFNIESDRRGSNPKISRIVRNLYLKEGPQSFFRGLIPTMLRDMPFTWGYLRAGEMIKPHVKKYISNDPAAQLISSGISALFNATISQPPDTIKTLMQAQTEKDKCDTMLQTCKRIYTKRGGKGFFDGYSLRLGRVFVAIVLLSEGMFYGKKAAMSFYNP